MTDVQYLISPTLVDLTLPDTSDLVCSNEDFTSTARALFSIAVSPPKTFDYEAGPLTPAESDMESSEEEEADLADEALFADLPPVHHGLVAEHLRSGIVRAWVASDMHEPDAEQAFFVADLGEVVRQLERWHQCLPGIEPFYAIKCNPDPYVIRLLASLGTGFDCASHGEIAQVLSIGGIDPDRIIFANPCKAASFIRHSARAGVHKMTFDNLDELYKVAKAHPKAELVLRILTDDTKSLCRLGLKYGAALETVPMLLEKAKELDLNIIGVSFHVGSGCYDSSQFADAVARARVAFDMGVEAGYDFRFLDVGGGFEDKNFEETASVLSVALEKYFPDRHALGLKVIAEPGRFFVSTAFTLATNVIARRAASEVSPELDLVAGGGQEEPKVMYYINDGVYGAFNCILFDHQVVHPYVLTRGRSFVTSAHGSALELSSVWGPTCDSIDCVCPTVTLPDTIQVDDWLGFENMGAYTICAASNFNGFQTSNVTYTSGVGEESGKVRCALRRLAASLNDGS